MDDSSLAERARAGDTTAYHCLMTRYQDIAFRAALLIIHDAVEAEDAAQEGFVKAFYALARTPCTVSRRTARRSTSSDARTSRARKLG